MADETPTPRKEKDRWDKLQIIFHPLNGLLTALTVALLGYYTSDVLRQNDNNQTDERVYTELMSSREQAESSLRKDMFTSIIDTFLRPGASSLDGRMLNLELLTYNFHESLNLKPLFSYMQRQVAASSGSVKEEYSARLRQIAREIKSRQLVLLEQVGGKFSRTVDLEMLKASGGISSWRQKS